MWSNCPFQWQKSYVEGLKEDDTNLNTWFGTAIHRTIQDWLPVVYGGSPVVAKTMDLSDSFKTILIEEVTPYIKQADDNQNVTYMCSREELEEYYQQGTEILSYVQTHSSKLFPTGNTELVGTEVELDMSLTENLNFVAYLDIVTHNKETDEYTIIDIKTSRRGWNDKLKNDPTKRSQLLLYKKFFSVTRNVPLNKIGVEFTILKREHDSNQFYSNPRVSKFVPPNGTPSVNKAWGEFQKFLDTCFDKNGEYRDVQHEPTPSKYACRFCAFKAKKDICPVGIK